ncbi:MAG TPA: hypothetical protein VMW72_10755 [Sedimentisphaerales bacterium]|nr:hypothetical protein [Sedimentisphaerales bacterium]
MTPDELIASCQDLFLFAQVLRRLKSTAQLKDFILLQALRLRQPTIHEAVLFEIEGAHFDIETTVTDIAILRRGPHLAPLLDSFHLSLDMDSLTAFRGKLLHSIQRKRFNTVAAPHFFDSLSDHYKLDAKCITFSEFRSSTPVVELTQGIVAIPIRDSFQTLVLVCSAGHARGDAITGPEKVVLALLGHIAATALTVRRIVRDATAVLEKTSPLLEVLQHDTGAFLFANSVISSSAHDLLNHCDQVDNSVRNILALTDSHLPEHRDTVVETLRGSISYIRQCLRTIVDVSRFRKPDKGSFQRVDVNPIVTQVIRGLEWRLTRDNSKIAFNAESRPCLARCNSHLSRNA